MNKKYKIIISEKLSLEGISRLKSDSAFEVVEPYSEDPNSNLELQRELADAEGLIIRTKTIIDKKFLEKAKLLKFICRAGVGFDNIDLEACSDKEIKVANTPAGNRTSAAEHAMALLLALAKKIPAADKMLHNEGWDREAMTGSEVAGKVLGIVGLGNIGGLVARRAHSFEMIVKACDPYIPEEKASQLGIPLLKLDQLFEESDFVSLHVPLTENTKKMVNQKLLGVMKPGAFLINTSRGAVVDEMALTDALKTGRLKGAGLDVFELEPLSDESLLRQLNNVILTPHVAGQTHEALLKISHESAEAVRIFFHKGIIANPLN